MLEIKNFKKNRSIGLSETKSLLTIHKGGLASASVHMSAETTPHQALINRKNSTMKFMVDFLSGIGGCLDEDEILKKAHAGLKNILPLRSMHVVLWNKNETDTTSLALRIAAPADAPEYQAWKETLLEQARFAMDDQSFSLVETPNFGTRATAKASSPGLPGDGPLLSIPLISEDDHLGQILLLLGEECVLDKEQALALDAAIRHLSLNMRNAGRFKIMQRYAEYDALTGVHNRRHFESRLDEEFRRFKRHGRPLSILMADIDHFKRINDTRGHQAGDVALREVASIIANTIRKTDYCARYGGEEFMILLPYTGAKKALALAERIRKIIALHIFLVNGCDPLNLTVSFGVCGTGTDTDRSKIEVLGNADAALYSAKSKGRNCSVLISPPRRKPQRK